MSSTLPLIENLLTGKFNVPAAEIRPDRTLEELDIDSLALAELTLNLQEQLGVDILEEDVHKTMTVAEAAAAVDGKLAAAGTTAR